MTLSGLPDWNLPRYQTASALADPGEIYNRLLRFASLDNRGRVLFLDTFDQGLSAWTRSVSGAGVNPKIDAIPPAFLAPVSVQLDPGAVSAGDLSSIVRTEILGTTSRVGLEVALRVSSSNGADSLFEIRYQYGGNVLVARLTRISQTSTHRWYVQTPGGTEVQISSQNINAGWVLVKLVADFSTQRYVRVIIGENEIDASAYNLNLTGSTSVPGLCDFFVQARSYGVNTLPLRIGAVIATRDEP